jgi:hypothetical protein
MNAKSMIRAGLLTTVLLAAAVPAMADPAAPDAQRQAPPGAHLLFPVRLGQLERARPRHPLSEGPQSRRLSGGPVARHQHADLAGRAPGVVVRGINTVCSPLDLDLRVSDGYGIAMPIMAKSITKLSAEEIAAIPKKDRP